jgi:hypothetical protein
MGRRLRGKRGLAARVSQGGASVGILWRGKVEAGWLKRCRGTHALLVTT